MTEPSVERAIESAAAASSLMLIGAMDTGKTTMAKAVIEAALDKRRTVAYIDADIGNPTVGPPACAGLKVIREKNDLNHLDSADRLHFVGGISPDRLILQAVIASAALAAEGAKLADLVVVDTTGTISGVAGETLKYHKAELIRPDQVIALQRGGELEPIIGMLRRFFSCQVDTVPADTRVIPLGPDHRAQRRVDRFASAFAPPLERWRVRPTVFAPTLPVGLDLQRLDGMLVGVQDGTGECLGLGLLEFAEDHLRVVTNAGEGMQGLRLGSLRLDLDTFTTRSVNLREIMFGF